MKKTGKFSIKKKISALILVAVVPLLALSIYLLISVVSYGAIYRDVIENITKANDYNITFKENIDESLYKLVVGYTTFEDIDNDKELKNPYTLIDELKKDFSELKKDMTDINSHMWMDSIEANVESLENRISDIEENLKTDGKYDENLKILDDSIYILTELIQEDIQQYIYYQTCNMEAIQSELGWRAIVFVISSAVMLLAILALIIYIAVYISRSITRPIGELVSVTEQIAVGNMEVRATVYEDDELGHLSNSVNSMTEDINRMMLHIKDDEHKMRNAEIRLLQEQINPHFLYNALDTIVWLIEVRENDKAVNMTMSLSNFFRLILSHGQEYIDVRQEEQHITSYLEIQQIRYADIMDYDIDIDDDIYDFCILKMTLQPIVENALYHGIKYKRAKGHISVRGYRENDEIKLIVKDDGVGIAEADLEALRKSIMMPCKDTDKGFGLANVNERIRMNFGEKYGMQLDSVAGEGTTVTVTLPAKLMEAQSKEANHEK